MGTGKEAPAVDPLIAEAERVQGELDGTAAASTTSPATASPAAPVLTLDRELAMVAETVGAVLASFFPSVKAVLTEKKCEEIGAAVAPVLVKYGLDRYVAGFAWKAEVEALMCVAPVVLAVKAAILHDLALMRAHQEKRDKAPPPAAGEGAPPPAAAPPAAMLQPVT